MRRMYQLHVVVEGLRVSCQRAQDVKKQKNKVIDINCISKSGHICGYCSLD